MPVKYRIDKLARIVHSQAGGELTDAEALTNQFGLKADPDFNPSYREFFDFSRVKPFSMTARGIQSLASSSPWRTRSFLTWVPLSALQPRRLYRAFTPS